MKAGAAKGLVVFLHIVVVILSVCDVAVVASSPFWLHAMYQSRFAVLRIMLGYNYAMSNVIYPLMLVFFIVCGLLCLGVLFEAYRILRRIRQNNPFCRGNAQSLRNAAFCALGLCAVFLIKMTFSPSILTLVCAGIFLLFALFVLVIAQLLLEAVRIKEENDLTI